MDLSHCFELFVGLNLSQYTYIFSKIGPIADAYRVPNVVPRRHRYSVNIGGTVTHGLHTSQWEQWKFNAIELVAGVADSISS